MKKRIGWLNNKPIIQGDKNLKNSNELHIDELSSSNSGGGGSEIKHHYYKFTTPITESLLGDGFNILLPAIGTLKLSLRDTYVFKTFMGLSQGGDLGVTMDSLAAFEFIPVTEGYIYLESRLAKDLKDYKYLYSLRDSNTATKLDFIIDNVIEITEEEYFNLVK